MGAAGDREAPFRGPGREGPEFSFHSVGEAPPSPKLKGALGSPGGPSPKLEWRLGDMSLQTTGLDHLEPVGKGLERSREPRGPGTQIYRSPLGGGVPV